MSTNTRPSDLDLIALAEATLDKIPATNQNHTIASVARSHSGATFVGANVNHFTGGPCSELVVLGVAAAAGVLAKDIELIVTVGRRPGEMPDKMILSPCGRCRQVLYDYNPEISVVVMFEGEPLTFFVRNLLPHLSAWPVENTEQETVPS